MQFKSVTKIALGLLAGTTCSILLLPEATLAQSLNTDPSQEFQKDGDPLTGGTGQSFSVFDLIHRSNLGSNRPPEEVIQEQNENLDEQANQLRSKQRQLLGIPNTFIDRLNPNSSPENTTTPNQ